MRRLPLSLPRSPWPVLAVVFLLSTGSFGCAYYNTFFYAKKYFNQALDEEKKNTTGKLSPSAAANYEKAIKQCSKVLQRYENSKWADDALFLMGRSYFGREEYTQSRRWFEELLSKYPDSPHVPATQFWIGRSYLAEDDFEKSGEILGKIATDFPRYENMDEVQFYLGDVDFRQERYAEAAERYETLVNRFPKSEYVTQSLIRIGDAQFSQKKYDLAEKSFDRAVDRSREPRERFDARLKVGQALEKQDRFAEALETYKTMAVEIIPQDRLNQILAGVDPNQQANTTNDPYGNQVQINNQNEDDPNNRNNPYNNTTNSNTIGNVNTTANQNYVDGNQTSRAAVAAALQQNPLTSELPRVLLRQGLSLSEMGNDEEAIRVFRGITQAWPRTSESAEAFYRIGYIQEVHMEKYEQARLSYDAARQQGVSLFSDEAHRRAEGLARLVALQAADTLKVADHSAQNEAEKDFLAAELYYFQQEKTDRALEQYAVVEKNYPKTPFAAKAALARAWILTFAVEDTAAGRAEYERVMRDYPETEQAKLANQVLTGEPPKPERPANADSLAAVFAVADSLAAAREDSLAAAETAAEAARDSLARRPQDLAAVVPSPPGTMPALPPPATSRTAPPVTETTTPPVATVTPPPTAEKAPPATTTEAPPVTTITPPLATTEAPGRMSRLAAPGTGGLPRPLSPKKFAVHPGRPGFNAPQHGPIVPGRPNGSAVPGAPAPNAGTPAGAGTGAAPAPSGAATETKTAGPAPANKPETSKSKSRGIAPRGSLRPKKEAPPDTTGRGGQAPGS